MLLSNNPGITRIGHCCYEISNIYNVEHYTNKLQPITLRKPLNSSELLFTQWSESPQDFISIRNKHYPKFQLKQRCRFNVCRIYKDDEQYYLRLAENWYLKYDGEDVGLVAQDYDYLRRMTTYRVQERLKREYAKKTVATVRKKAARPRARPRARPMTKRRKLQTALRKERGKTLVQIANRKSNKKNVN